LRQKKKNTREKTGKSLIVVAFYARACYNKIMKRQTSTILSIGAALVAGVATISGVLSLQGANAEELSTDAFITPATYEQYLPLDTPNGMAFSSRYTAIADGNLIHVYDSVDNVYRTYTHTANHEAESNRIKKLQYTSDNVLYFLDVSGVLRTLSPSELLSGATASSTGFSCSNFLIDANTMYYTVSVTTESTLYKVPLDVLSSTSAETVQPRIVGTPVISSDGYNLYYVDGGKTLKQAGADTYWMLMDSDTISSMAVLDGFVYYTTEYSKDFYVFDLAQNLLHASYGVEDTQNSYSSVAVFEENVYVVKNQSVCQYSPEEDGFTQFEIGASSLSTHRLQQGTESVLFEDKLYVADAGAKRISIYDVLEKSYTTIDNTIEATFIATDGKTVLLASSDTLALYDTQTKEAIPVTGADVLNGVIVGITQIYDNYYFVTNYHQYGKISYDGVWTAQTINRDSAHYLSRYPHLLTSDVQGNLYLLMTDGCIYRLTEDLFLSQESLGEPIYTGVSLSSKKLLVDYDQNVYALQDNRLLKYTTVAKNSPTKFFELGKEMAYTQTTATPVTTVTFGVENDVAYLLYDGNLIISTLDFELP
jgi:hypothetical protein